MIPFLKAVAEGYTSRFKTHGLAKPYRYCFVFPNKRAGTFFLKYLRELNPDGIIAPEISTISDFTARLSGRVINSRIDLIFLLYNCYCDLLNANSGAGRERAVSFDAFRKWGETVLRDFNEVDMQNVDADAIFSNVADFRRISSSFLTEEQRKVIEEYFGYSTPNYDENKFWIDFDKEVANGEISIELPHLERKVSDTSGTSPASEASQADNESKKKLRTKFIHLWKILAPLYHRFHDEMKRLRLSSSGAAYRLAIQNLESAIDADDDTQLRKMLPMDKLVMIGFNALSMSERELFRLLKRIDSPNAEEGNLTDFVWDRTGPILSDRNNSAGRFVTLNMRDFPAPEWLLPFLKRSDAKSLPPRLEQIAAPSKVMQVKIAAGVISKIKEELTNHDSFADAKVALVVPEESLLLPLLYSMPKDLQDVNLTMGYPLKLTSVTSFLVLLRRLQMMRRDSKQYNGYAFEPLSDLLSHPYSHAIFSTPLINKFRKDKEKRHVNVIRETDLKELGEKAAEILRPLQGDSTSTDVIRYLDRVLEIIGQTLYKSRNMVSADDYGLIKGDLEMQNVAAWRDALRLFEDSIREYKVELGVAATLAEAYRLLQGEIVAFEGEPLHGLQIMGLLETRALDFDHLVIVGLNDRTIPGRMRQRSFIPNVIRRGFGMPPNGYQEELFGYYFYRLISRAQRATFIFDNRVTGSNGGESRYLLQLKYLYAPQELKKIEYKFSLAGRDIIHHEIEKTADVQKALLRYCDPEFKIVRGYNRRKNLSASLLKTLTDCELKFYYKAVLDLKDDPAPSPSVDAISMGNFIHKVMEMLYVPNKQDREKWIDIPIEITPSILDEYLDDEGQDYIYRIIQRLINHEHYHKPDDHIDDPLPIDTEIIAKNLRKYVNDILNYDRRLAPFKIYGVEIRENLEYKLLLNPEDEVAKHRFININMEYALDRVDDAECENPGELRIVDYKTGGSHISANSLKGLFESDYRKNNLLQLLIYSLLANLKREEAGLPTFDYKLRIYPAGRIMNKIHDSYNLRKEMEPRIDKSYIITSSDIADDFKVLFDKQLHSIFDWNRKFCADVSFDKCSRCAFFGACSS